MGRRCPMELSLCNLLHAHVRFGHRVPRLTERVADCLVGIEVDLPIVIGVRVGTHGQHGAALIEVENFHIGRRLASNVGSCEY